MVVIFGSGHRPEDTDLTIGQMCDLCAEHISAAVQPITTVISGGAAGFDLAIALAAIDLDLNLYVARPWAGHKPRVAERSAWERVAKYSHLSVFTINESETYPGASAYHNRNKWMVDNANAGLVFWNGKTSGGTYACIKYADSVGKPYRNIFPKLVG